MFFEEDFFEPQRAQRAQRERRKKFPTDAGVGILFEEFED